MSWPLLYLEALFIFSLHPSFVSSLQILQYILVPLNSSNLSNSFLPQCLSSAYASFPLCFTNFFLVSLQVPVFRLPPQSSLLRSSPNQDPPIYAHKILYISPTQHLSLLGLSNYLYDYGFNIVSIIRFHAE